MRSTGPAASRSSSRWALACWCGPGWRCAIRGSCGGCCCGGERWRELKPEHDDVISRLSQKHRGEDRQDADGVSGARAEERFYRKRTARRRREGGDDRGVVEGGFPTGPRPRDGDLRAAERDEERG